ncbi:MAG: hypothetical protein ACTS4T_01945 [Candidatus Hodgkinia cicadicola]
MTLNSLRQRFAIDEPEGRDVLYMNRFGLVASFANHYFARRTEVSGWPKLILLRLGN